MRRAGALGAVLGAAMTWGCSPATTEVACVLERAPIMPVADTRVQFSAALKRVQRHNEANDWTEQTCTSTVAELLGADAAGGAIARYDAALVERRCGRHEAARALLHDALDLDPGLSPARVMLSLYAAEQPDGLDLAITGLWRVVTDARFADAEADVELAALQMRRGGRSADEDGLDDFERARKNLGRALAADDRYMPAFDQLARLHLARARRGGERAGRRAALDLAALTCAQAMEKNPRYAPIRNTAGLVEMERGDPTRAARFFDEARRLDPRLVEAQLNYAAVNLGFRGFAQAEEAYRAVLGQRPNDYDAHLGLSLALRGQLGPDADPARVAAAARELAKARTIAPERPEAYYNEAILVQEFGGRSAEQDQARAELGRAKLLYGTFIQKAGGAAAFGEARRRAKERMDEIDAMERFAASAPAPPAPPATRATRKP